MPKADAKKLIRKRTLQADFREARRIIDECHLVENIEDLWEDKEGRHHIDPEDLYWPIVYALRHKNKKPLVRERDRRYRRMRVLREDHMKYLNALVAEVQALGAEMRVSCEDHMKHLNALVAVAQALDKSEMKVSRGHPENVYALVAVAQLSDLYARFHLMKRPAYTHVPDPTEDKGPFLEAVRLIFEAVGLHLTNSGYARLISNALKWRRPPRRRKKKPGPGAVSGSSPRG